MAHHDSGNQTRTRTSQEMLCICPSCGMRSTREDGYYCIEKRCEGCGAALERARDETDHRDWH